MNLDEEKEVELMEFQKTHIFKSSSTSIEESQAFLHQKNRFDLKAMSLSVYFHEWQFPSKNFESWTRKMAALHKPTWEKAGIFEAVMASSYRIERDTDLVLSVAERWSPETKSFVFSWGETSITLEDVMVLLGFSVLGLPVFAALDSSGEMTKSELEKEWDKIKEDKIDFVTQSAWMSRFMDSNDDELEHVAFLACWLSYFVFPLCYDHISEAVLPIAVHLSSGNKIALAPAVLAHLYAELSLLKNHIEAFGESTVTVKTELTALFKLVQVWTWERFKEMQPKPNPLLKGEPRLALWHEKQRKIDDVRRILDNSKVDRFEWRPFTKAVENWEFPRVYPEETMMVPVGPSLDEEFSSFARCIKVSELVGIDYMEHYLPDRVAKQFGLLQEVPCVVKKKNPSKEEAWSHYNRPIDDSTLRIPSRYAIPCVTPEFSEWWKKTFQEFQTDSEKKQSGGLILADIDDSVPCENLASISDDGDEAVPQPEAEKMIEETEHGLSQIGETNFSDASLGGNEVDIFQSPPETKQTCEDEVDVCGTNADMINDGREGPNLLVQDDVSNTKEKPSLDDTLCTEAEKEDDGSNTRGKASLDDTLFTEAEKEDDVVDDLTFASVTNSDIPSNFVADPFLCVQGDPPQKAITSSSSEEDVGAGDRGSSSSKKGKQKKGSGKKPIGKVTLNPTDADWPEDVPEDFGSCEKNWSEEGVDLE